MSDPVFVAAAYAIVLGALGAYAVTIGRRVRAARRTTQILEQERSRARPADRSEAASDIDRPPMEARP